MFFLKRLFRGGHLIHKVERHLIQNGSCGRVVRSTFFASAGILLASCAGQMAPSGGPPDRTPPLIVGTIPDTNAVRVSTQEITIELSKYVERRSLEESVFFSPSVGDHKFDWSGREVTIHFNEPLRPKTTYVVTIGTDVVDLREHNRMDSGFTLAFSTGDSIDRGRIRGRIDDTRPEGVMVFAYRLNERDADTLNPAHTKPDFLMQSGQGGRFTLSNLPWGRYRVFAVRDEYKNLLYDREIDQIGMPRGDLVLAEARPEIDGVDFRLTREDTSRPFVTSAMATTRRTVEVRFSEPMDSLRLSEKAFSVQDTSNGQRLPLHLAYWKSAAPPTAWLLLGVALDSPATYRVQVRGISDRAGNPIQDSNASALFEGILRPDTLRPLITLGGLRDSARAVRPEDPLTVDFSEPIERAPFDQGVSLGDSLGHAVACLKRWATPVKFLLQPKASLKSKAWYRLVIVLDSVRSYGGFGYRDSLLEVRFQTLDMKTTGEIEGILSDPTPGGGGYQVSVESVDLSPKEEQSISLAGPGQFVLSGLREGRYRLSGFQDTDKTGRYRYGSPFPFVPAERFAVSPDTLKVRARWGLEGVALRFN
jgi:hypothetical protein